VEIPLGWMWWHALGNCDTETTDPDRLFGSVDPTEERSLGMGFRRFCTIFTA
jgi:hypothetical protein